MSGPLPPIVALTLALLEGVLATPAQAGFVTMSASTPAGDGAHSCTLQQHSSWTNDEGVTTPSSVYMMYDTAQTRDACLALCLSFDEKNIRPNVDMFASLGFSCYFDEKILATQTHK